MGGFYVIKRGRVKREGGVRNIRRVRKLGKLEKLEKLGRLGEVPC